jgi:hypothetical protein
VVSTNPIENKPSAIRVASSASAQVLGSSAEKRKIFQTTAAFSHKRKERQDRKCIFLSCPWKDKSLSVIFNVLRK